MKLYPSKMCVHDNNHAAQGHAIHLERVDQIQNTRFEQIIHDNPADR